MFFFNKKNHLDYKELVSKLENASDHELEQLLWQPKNTFIEYLDFSKDQVKKFRKNNNENQSLNVHLVFRKGIYELIIFESVVPIGETPYNPLLINAQVGKVIGVMLPFNELNGYLNKRDQQHISSLALQWTTFIIDYRFSSTK